MMNTTKTVTSPSGHPVLSIAVPSYNVEKYLEKGLESFADARLSEKLEVLIVNDGSTDSTETIAQRYVDAQPTIFRLINKQNGGHGSAVNAGIEHATGKYFRIVDGDDWVNTDNLVKLIELLETTDSDIVVDQKREVHMVTGETQLFEFPTYIKAADQQSFEEVCLVEDVESYISIHTLSVKTDLLHKHQLRLLEGIFYVDYEYLVKTTCNVKTITFIDLEIYQYLIGNVNQSVAGQNYVKRYDQHQKVIRELLDFYSKNTFDKTITQYLEKKIELLINTQYNILLIFDTDRSRGRTRAREFKTWLTNTYPSFASKTNSRYRQARILGRLGVDKDRLDRLMGR